MNLPPILRTRCTSPSNHCTDFDDNLSVSEGIDTSKKANTIDDKNTEPKMKAKTKKIKKNETCWSSYLCDELFG